jgi:N-acetylmuramoyl-L-alanine amidase
MLSANAIYGDQTEFPVFQLSAEERARRIAEANPDVEKHFDAGEEIRTKGAAFYRFSKDEAERERELAELKRRTDETAAMQVKRAEEMQKHRKEREDRLAMVRAKREELEKKRRRAAGLPEEEGKSEAKRTKTDADSFLDGLGLAR